MQKVSTTESDNLKHRTSDHTTASMAVAISLSIAIDPQHNLHCHHHSQYRFLNPNISRAPPPKPLLFLSKSRRPYFKSSSSDAFDSSSSSSDSPSTATASLPPEEDSKPTSLPQDPFRTNRFLTNDEYEKLKFLENFSYREELGSGSLWVRAMTPDLMDATANLLAESFAESMMLPSAYVKLLGFLVRQYLTERRAAMPHAVTIVGFYRGTAAEDGGEGAEELAGTVEVSFDKSGANDSPPTPSPPKEKPYICNMTVKKHLRRKGIGWRLLKASEKLISETASSKEVYLHCRMIDTAPFNMYSKAGYNVVETDSIFVLLMLQRRKHLMCKNLPTLDSDSESDISGVDEELNLSIDV